jgi:hypothetical protein
LIFGALPLSIYNFFGSVSDTKIPTVESDMLKVTVLICEVSGSHNGRYEV